MSEKIYIYEDLTNPLVTAAFMQFEHQDKPCLLIELWKDKFHSFVARTFSKEEAVQMRDALNKLFPKE